MRSDELFLEHILKETGFLLQKTQSLTFEDFMQDDMLKRASSRSVISQNHDPGFLTTMTPAPRGPF